MYPERMYVEYSVNYVTKNRSNQILNLSKSIPSCQIKCQNDLLDTETDPEGMNGAIESNRFVL